MTRICRILGALATLAGALLAFIVVSPAAFADHVPPPGGGSGAVSGVTRTVPWPKTPVAPTQPPLRTVVAGGMPGWQVALIAAGAALIAAVLAVLADRAWAARRRQMAGAT